MDRVHVEGPGSMVLPWQQNNKHDVGIYYCNITCICIKQQTEPIPCFVNFCEVIDMSEGERSGRDRGHTVKAGVDCIP